MRHPLFAAIVLVGSSLAGCRTQPLPEPKDLAENDLAESPPADMAMCNCGQQPLPDPCRVPCILIL